MTELFPLHQSMRDHITRRAPPGLDKVVMPFEDHAALTQIALDIFTACINSGTPMQDAILAVYVTGLENGYEMSKEITSI